MFRTIRADFVSLFSLCYIVLFVYFNEHFDDIIQMCIFCNVDVFNLVLRIVSYNYYVLRISEYENLFIIIIVNKYNNYVIFVITSSSFIFLCEKTFFIYLPIEFILDKNFNLLYTYLLLLVSQIFVT